MRAGSPDIGLGVARRTAVGVEGRTEAISGFAGNAAGHRVDLLEPLLRSAEKVPLVGVEPREYAAGAPGSTPRSRIRLRQNTARATQYQAKRNRLDQCCSIDAPVSRHDFSPAFSPRSIRQTKWF